MASPSTSFAQAGRAAHASPVIIKPTIRFRVVRVMPCLPSFGEAETADENWHEPKTHGKPAENCGRGGGSVVGCDCSDARGGSSQLRQCAPRPTSGRFADPSAVADG